MTPFDELLRRAWPIFHEVIRQKRTISYSELAGRVGPPLTARAIHRQLLTPLSARCRDWKMPDLASLVVRKETGIPGQGWFDPLDAEDPLDQWRNAVERCYLFAWKKQVDPRLLVDREG